MNTLFPDKREYPDRREADRLLSEAESLNSGPWAEHSRNVARCAEKIALACGMDGEKAYSLGLTHDIGRRFGARHLGHVCDGYKYMTDLGYAQAARICLTHSFGIKDVNTYIGKFDVSSDELEELKAFLNDVEYDDYDRLIQLCDAMGDARGIVDIEERMRDVEERYGFYPQEKRNKNLQLKSYFEEKIGRDIYCVVKN